MKIVLKNPQVKFFKKSSENPPKNPPNGPQKLFKKTQRNL
jgi:hypothetical protein